MSENVKPGGDWRVFLVLGRVSNLPTVWSNCLAGVILAGASPSWAPYLLLAGGITLFYVGGMYLNDAFDQAWDARNRPGRPIPSGRIRLEMVYALGFGQVLLGLALLIGAAWVSSPGETPVVGLGGVALGLVIVYYNFRHKQNPLGPLVMALTRALVYFIAAALAGASLAGGVLAGMVVLLGYLIGLTYVAKQETLREVKNLWPLAFLGAPFLFTAWRGTQAGGLNVEAGIIGVTLLVWVVWSLTHLFHTGTRNIPRVVVSLIAGISLVDALLVALAGGESWAWVAAAGFPLTLFFQRYISGT